MFSEQMKCYNIIDVTLQLKLNKTRRYSYEKDHQRSGKLCP